ncbi:hypothetical protein HDV05_000676, partial [Chytridiales sp. JEL 0842]
MSTAAKYIRRYYLVIKAVTPRVMMLTVLTIGISAVVRLMYASFVYRSGTPLAYSDNTILFGFYFYMTMRTVAGCFINKTKFLVHEVFDFFLASLPMCIFQWIIFFCTRQLSVGQSVALMLVVQNWSTVASLLTGLDPNVKRFSAAHFLKSFVLGHIVSLFTWATLFVMSLTFWISNYSNSNLDSDFTGFFSVQNMVFLIYTGIFFPFLKNGLISFYINKGIASLVNKKGEDAMRTLAWQLQFSMGYEIFFSLPGKIITFRTSNNTIFIVSVFFYCFIDMGFRIFSAIGMKKRIQLVVEAVAEAAAEEEKRTRANPHIASANEVKVHGDDDDDWEPDFEKRSSTKNIPALLTEDFPDPVKVFNRDDMDNTVPNQTIDIAVEIAKSLSLATLSAGKSLASLRGSKASLKVGPLDLEKGCVHPPAGANDSVSSERKEEPKQQHSTLNPYLSIKTAPLARKLSTTVMRAATTIKDATKDDGKEEDFEAFTNGMDHLRSVNKAATTVKAAKRAATLKRGSTLAPISRKPTTTTTTSSPPPTETHLQTTIDASSLPQINIQALKRVFALNSMAACFAEWTSRLVCIIFVVVFVSYTPETTCYGQPTFQQTLIYGGIMLAVSTLFDVIGAVVVEGMMEFDVGEGARAFGRMKLGWRVVGYFLVIMSPATNYLRRYYLVLKALTPRVLMFTLLTTTLSALVRLLYTAFVYKPHTPLAYADNTILFGFFFYMTTRVMAGAFVNKTKFLVHEVFDFVLAQTPIFVLMWVIFFCARQFTAGQCVSMMLILQNWSVVPSLVAGADPNVKQFSKTHILKSVVMAYVVSMFSWATLFIMSLTFWISNYSNSTLDSDLTGFFSLQNMVFLVYTGVFFPFLKNGLINAYVNKGIASLVNKKGEDAMRTLAWQLQFSMGYEIFFSLPGKMITFRTPNDTIFIVSVVFYCFIDMGFRIFSAMGMKKRIQLVVEAVAEASAAAAEAEEGAAAVGKDDEERTKIHSTTVNNDQLDDDEDWEPQFEKKPPRLPPLLTEDLPNPTKLFNKDDMENTVPKHAPELIAGVAADLAKSFSLASLAAGKGLGSLRGSKGSLRVGPFGGGDVEKGFMSIKITTTTTDAAAADVVSRLGQQEEEKKGNSGHLGAEPYLSIKRSPSLNTGALTRKLTSTVKNAATTIKDATKDDDKDEDFETFTDAMSHFQSVNRVATSVKASKRAETLKK